MLLIHFHVFYMDHQLVEPLHETCISIATYEGNISLTSTLFTCLEICSEQLLLSPII